MRRLLACVAVAALAATAGCGGGGTKSLAKIQSCLTAAHYSAEATPGVAHQLTVGLASAPTTPAFTVTINPSEGEAKKQVGDQKAEFGPQGANTGGGAASSGRVVVAYARPEPAADLKKVEGCAF